MRVLVVDDHEIVRRGVRNFLQEAGLEVCGEAVDGADAIIKAKELSPDAVIMDVSLSNLNGIEATMEIVRRHPAIRVVILSQHDFPHIIRQAVHAGASAYVVKSAISTELVPALEKTCQSAGALTPYVFGSAQRNVPVQEILQRGAALETALRESEERYRLTFEQAAVGMARRRKRPVDPCQSKAVRHFGLLVKRAAETTGAGDHTSGGYCNRGAARCTACPARGDPILHRKTLYSQRGRHRVVPLHGGTRL